MNLLNSTFKLDASYNISYSHPLMMAPPSAHETKRQNERDKTKDAECGEPDDDTKKQHAFNFPFPPYSIQEDLMKKAYEAFEESKFALLESPTGTGKTLSLICSSLTWLRDYQRKTRKDLEVKRDDLLTKIEDLRKEEESSGDWLSAQTKRQDLSRALGEITKQLEKLDVFDGRNQARRHAKLHGIPLENYSSFSCKQEDPNRTIDGPLNESRDINLIGGGASQESNKSETANDNEDDMESQIAKQDEEHVKPKIYFASRTHSQLSQFVNEVKKTIFAKPKDTSETPIKVAALASRANLCVNPEVLKLRDPSAINEGCMQLQRETNTDKRCPYGKAKQVNNLKDDILSEVYDIEDLVGRGRAKGGCPYYASRMAIPEAELVVLPYNNLLHRETRQAASLDLNGNIVIVDEAHNVLETICSIHSAPISGLQLIGCHTIFSRYYKEYGSRMSPSNANMVKSMVQCLTSLIRYLNNPEQHLRDHECPRAISLDDSVIGAPSGDKKSTKERGKICKPVTNNGELMFDINKFSSVSNMERFNVFKIVDYMNRSRLARKLLGFYRRNCSLDLTLEIHKSTIDENQTERQEEDEESALKSPKRKRKKTTQANTKNKKPPAPKRDSASKDSWEYTSLEFLKETVSSSPCKQGKIQDDVQLQSYPIYQMTEFFKALTNSLDDGKVLTSYKANDIFKSTIKFLLLNPSSQFKQMVSEARSILLAGGTMQPFDEFIELLFGPLGVDEGRLKLFSCGHVISPDHLYMASLYNGPSNKPLELSFRVRNSFENIDEIGRTIMNISFVVPGGMVCFLPSYEYETICYNRWMQLGIISKIETRSKVVFREPRLANQLKPIFEEYAKMIEKGKKTGRGALLLCVVGGKMSEGINFNDNLGRCVVMVGLPYANIKSGELREKMAYYDKTCKSSKGPTAGQKYYENMCIKSINQSIGRAIRHKEDYAAVVLLDHRYQTKSGIRNGLPKWMSSTMKEHERFGPLFSQLKTFYDNIQSKSI